GSEGWINGRKQSIDALKAQEKAEQKAINPEADKHMCEARKLLLVTTDIRDPPLLVAEGMSTTQKVTCLWKIAKTNSPSATSMEKLRTKWLMGMGSYDIAGDIPKEVRAEDEYDGFEIMAVVKDVENNQGNVIEEKDEEYGDEYLCWTIRFDLGDGSPLSVRHDDVETIHKLLDEETPVMRVGLTVRVGLRTHPMTSDLQATGDQNKLEFYDIIENLKNNNDAEWHEKHARGQGLLQGDGTTPSNETVTEEKKKTNFYKLPGMAKFASHFDTGHVKAARRAETLLLMKELGYQVYFGPEEKRGQHGWRKRLSRR
ncbi:hypothetical protein N9L68_03725, partial [bacterium]|nr:hypothetical protein [bacterium]